MVESPASAVVAHGLTLRHRHHVALRDVDLHIPAGRVTAVIGPNGSGKSTLLDAIAGLLPPASGMLHVLGHPPGHRSDSHAAGVAYVLQSTDVNESLPVTVREIVTMGRYAHVGAVGRLRSGDRAAVDAALERLEVTDLADRHPRELSGGQRQRVFVAQGLAQQAALLLLDEPVTGLDLVSRDRILTVVAEERSAGHTVVLSTHDLGDARRADHVVLLAGRVVAEGPPGDVLSAEHLAVAYRGRLVRVDADTLLLDDAAHDHDHS